MVNFNFPKVWWGAITIGVGGWGNCPPPAPMVATALVVRQVETVSYSGSHTKESIIALHLHESLSNLQTGRESCLYSSIRDYVFDDNKYLATLCKAATYGYIAFSCQS